MLNYAKVFRLASDKDFDSSAVSIGKKNFQGTFEDKLYINSRCTGGHELFFLFFFALDILKQCSPRVAAGK